MKSIDKINNQLVLRGLTGAELCRGIGLSNSVYSLWNTGKNNPSNKTIAKIAYFLQVDIEELLDDEIIEAMKEAESAKEKKPAGSDGLSEDETMLLAAYQQIAPKKRPIYLEILQRGAEHKE